MQDMKKKIIFFFHRLFTTLTLGFWRKNIFKKFSKPVLYKNFQISGNSQILFGTTMVLTLKVLVTSTVKNFVKKLIEAIVNMYMKTGKIWNGSSCPSFAHKRTHYRGVPKIWDKQKSTFFRHFIKFGHEGAPNVTQIDYYM